MILPLHSGETIRINETDERLFVSLRGGDAEYAEYAGCDPTSLCWVLSRAFELQIDVGGMLNTDVGAGTPHGSHCSPSLSKPGWMEQQLLSSDERQSVKESTGCA